MTDDGPSDLATDSDASTGASSDFDLLERIGDRLRGDDRFEDVEPRPPYAPAKLVCRYDPTFYPERVEAAKLEIRWFANGDFSIHYHESHADGSFDHRWDRHPSAHNARDHVHPGPEAPTPGDDASHPADWRDVLAAVLEEIETRQRAFWTDF